MIYVFIPGRLFFSGFSVTLSKMGIFGDLRRDFRAVFDKDPAAKSGLQVLLSYPGFHAIVFHRVAHGLKRLGVPVLPNFLACLSRALTGIEIHPAAVIGPGFFIDHGMGVVIGETTEIGADCLLYQGVTLGGTGKEKGKRHPTLGNNVVVGAGAKILGPVTIGDYVKIGANSVVLKSVPEHSIVVGIPGRVIKRKVLKVYQDGLQEVLDHFRMPDPYEEKFSVIEGHLQELQRRMERLEGKEGALKIFNTLSGRKETFVPLAEGRIGMYVCGVTVYDVCHIGHARSAVVFDVVRRYLRYKGFDVEFVKNFTDIDDKIINRARAEGASWDAVAGKYTEKYYADMHRLGVEDADVEPRATEHIKEIIELVAGLIERGHAYSIDGDVYFSVPSFPEYGKLSGRKLDEMLAGARVEVDPRKKNPMDFALWKSSKEGEPAWQSPWGPGRPGWHIECSAMSMKHLGRTLDIHAGGADLIFPHHENEIAQSEAYNSKPFVRYWMHNGFITVNKEKMSKSLGNFFTIQEILDIFDPEAVRLFLLQTHYRSPIEFSNEPLEEATQTLVRYYQGLERLDDFLFLSLPEGKKENCPPGFEDGILGGTPSGFKARFMQAMDDDFNTALAIGHVFELVKEMNRFLDQAPTGKKAKEFLLRAKEGLFEAAGVLNVFNRTPAEWQRALLKIKKIGLEVAGIERLIGERREARARKDFLRADEIRSELEQKGIALEDKKDSTAWRVKL